MNGLKSSIKANPATPILKLAKDGGLSNFIIWKAIKDDLGYMSRARGDKHLLTDKNKAVRVAKGKKDIKAMKTKGGDFWTLDFLPPNLPNLNPCNFDLLGHIKGQACKSYHASIPKLRPPS